uniref:Putative capsid protein n=1 Tax=viral metagenome TaxID=1070528 RepID=A0A6H1ZKH3_9ZZZZ
MISLKRSKKDIKKANKEMSVGPSMGEEYPYGTRLRFEKEEIDKIDGLKNVNAGDSISLKAIGTITGVSIRDSDKGEGSRTVEIQIEKISVDHETEEKKGFNDKEDDD